MDKTRSMEITMRNPGSDTPPNGPRRAPAPAQSDDSALMAELYQDLASLPIEVSRKWEAHLRAAAQSRPAVDVFEAYRTWPVGLRAKLSMHDLREMSGWVAPAATGKFDLQVQLAALYDTAAKGFHISETCGTDGKYWHVSKFRTLADLHAFEDARRVLLLAERDRRTACGTCNDSGLVGGLLPAGGGYVSDSCPDCLTNAAFDVDKFVRDCCETDPADPENTDTLCIKIGELTEVVLRHVMPLVKS